jgi:hypothetical protein
MWDCEHCGCKSIAASLIWCPMCREESYGLDKYGPPHKAKPVVEASQEPDVVVEAGD